MKLSTSPFIIIALGGSLVSPHVVEKGPLDVLFLRRFRKFLLKELSKGRRFCLIVGGGKIARQYQKAAGKVVSVPPEDLDWIGIHAIRLNAHLLRTIFAKEAHPVVIDHDPSEKEVKTLNASHAQLFIASGWRPGWSTDYVAVRLAQLVGAKEVIIAGDTAFVHEKDPRKFPLAKPVHSISWERYARLIPRKWKPGLSLPVDPVATKLAGSIGLKAKILKGNDLKNFAKAIEGKPFTGTLIQ